MTEATEVVLPHTGEPDALELRSRTLPPPASGEALVRMEAAGISFAEQQMRRGRYPFMPKFPFVPGYDVVGVVEATGPDTAGIRVGQRVVAVTRTGGWADRMILPAKGLVPVPEGVDPQQAETMAMNGLTAWQLVHRSAKVQAGQTVLIHGASGGVGTLLVQIAHLAGATVIGTASPAKHDVVRRLGADHVLDYREDVAAAVRRIAPDGVDAAFDHVGGAALQETWSLLTRRGTVVSYGNLTSVEGGNVMLNYLRATAKMIGWNLLPGKGRAKLYYVPTASGRKGDQVRADFAQLFAQAAAGKLVGEIAGVYPLEQVAEAMRFAESGSAIGKVVLTP